ncbi:hypothetical protein [Mycoplasma sp. E35C]|uniref:hypothetical protein n=1 Tax=Mycoplasma sp. E35C TaxID=2801918 RepID=UPI001CA3F150|nr:hypothetical protein [Mycoplasma sp. E35C]QZX49036.1 hypothetical protein JJE79_03190 [Mycoplasma sp. E35C]
MNRQIGSLNIQSILIIVLSIVALIVVVLYGAYFVIFLRVRRSINRNYKFREKYNVLSAKNYSLTIQQLTKLADRRSDLKYVVEYVNKFNKFYREQIESVYEPIKELSNFDYHFDFEYTKKASIQITRYLDKAESLDRSFTEIKGDISGYKNNSSALIVQFKELLDKLNKFLERHILPTFDNEELLRMVDSFSKCLMELEDSATMLLNKRLLAVVDHLLNNLPALIKMCKTYFLLNKLRVRLKYYLSDINYSCSILEKDANFSELRKKEILIKVNYANKDLVNVFDLLMNRQFKDAQRVLDDKLNLIAPLRKELEIETKSKATISVIKESFNYWISHFVNNFDQLKTKLDKLLNNFTKDLMLMEQIKELTTKSGHLRMLIEQINYQNERTITHKNYLQLINNIAIQASKLNDSLEVLIKTIADNIAIYENFLFNTNNLKLQFALIKNYYQDNEIKNDNLYKMISENNNQLIQIESNLYKNYKENINKFDALHENIEKSFILALTTLMKEVALKELCDQCFMFLNKYIYEAEDIRKYASDFYKQLYDNGLYEECLNKLIILLTKMKQVAKENQIVLS